MVVGIGWDFIMEAAVDSLSQLYISLYFIAFVVIFHILFADVFIGIVCESFTVSAGEGDANHGCWFGCEV